MPIILVIAVLALLFLSRRADAGTSGTAGGYGAAGQAAPTGPSSPAALPSYFAANPPPSVPGQYTVYDSAGQPTPLKTTVAPDGTAKIKIQGIPWSYTVPGTVPAPPPPPPMSEGGAPPPPPVYGGSTVYGSTATRSGAGHFV